MSLMPKLGAIVRLKDGRVGIISRVTPLGTDDQITFIPTGDEPVTVDDIDAVLHEPEPDQ